MLETLYIENVALIRRLEVDFTRGFQALTGQTGAGKSILIDSIGLLTGNKADRSLIRTGEEYALVWGIFSGFSPSAVDELSKLDISPDGEGKLTVERQISIDGRGKIKVGGSPVSLGTLKAISPYLVDIHGQSDTLTLYDSTSYIRILDDFAQIAALSVDYKSAYEKYSAIRGEINEITRSEAERLRTIEMLTYQLTDIDALKLKVGEDEILEEKEKRIKNSERIFRQTSFAWKALKGAEKGNALMLIDRCVAAVETLQDVIGEAETLANELKDCKWRLDDLAERIHDLGEDYEEDPAILLNKIAARLNAIDKAKKKYGSTVSEVLEYRNQIASRLALLQNADDRLEELRLLLKDETARCVELADRLHAKRLEAGEILSGKVVEILTFLDMPRVTFRVSVEPMMSATGEYELGTDGYDNVDFMISANKGEDMHSLSRVASGGELARIMLALKSVESERTGMSAMIFDEIDSGVSGQTARKIGLKLLDLSKKTQIFCVTHSAQIASLADVHYLISKHEEDGRTITTLLPLDEEGRINELSRVLGGIRVTDAQRRAAVDMREEKIHLDRA